MDEQERKIWTQLQRGRVRIRDYQREHCITLIKIMKCRRGYLDTSEPGLGKTYVALAIALYYDLPLLVIGPTASENVWRVAVEETGAKLTDFITKDALRSQKGCQPKHGYLVRDDSEKGVVFHETKKFTDFIQKGGLVVIDECHFVKNSGSAQHKATKALINYLVETGGRSRFALLSATPFDKLNHIVGLLRMIGYIRGAKLCTRGRDGLIYKNQGVEYLLGVCTLMDPEKTEKIHNACRPRNAAGVKEMVRILFKEIIKYHISSAAIPPQLHIRVDIKNGYYKADEKTRKKFLEALEDFKDFAQYREDTDTANRRQLVASNIMYQRTKIELLKVPTFAKIVRATLEATPKAKIIFGVHFIKTLKMLKESLKDLDPILMQGSVKSKERTSRIHQFQTNPEKQVMLGIIQVMSESISLHDSIGDAPRTTFVSPSYGLLQMTQFIRRTLRDGDQTKSDVTVRFVYLQNCELETAIFDALSRKSQILKDGLVRPQELLLPSDFESYNEE